MQSRSYFRLGLFLLLVAGCDDSGAVLDSGVADSLPPQDGGGDGALVNDSTTGADLDLPLSDSGIASSCLPTSGRVLRVGPSQGYKTIGSALLVAQAGETIVVDDGLYIESLHLTRGGTNAVMRLVICAEHPRMAVIQSTGTILTVDAPWVTVQGFVLDGGFGSNIVVRVGEEADHLILRDLEVKNSRRNGIDIGGGEIGGCQDILIEGCTVHHMLAGSDGYPEEAHCIAATDVRDLMIRDTEAYYCSGDVLHVGGDRDRWEGVTVEGCDFWTGPLPEGAAGFQINQEPGQSAVDTRAAHQGTAWKGTIAIRDSVFHGFPNKGYAALNLQDQITGVVERCTLYENSVALHIWGELEYGGVEDLVVKNTVLCRNRKHMQVSQAPTNVHLLHNTFGQLIDSNGEDLPLDSFQYNTSVLVGSSSGTEEPGWLSDNNLFYTDSLPVLASGAGDVNSTDTGIWVDMETCDYHLNVQMNAPSGVGVTVDRDNKPRSANNPDVGAYEL